MSETNTAEHINRAVDTRLKGGNFRHEIAKFVDQGATNILENGFGAGSLLLGLQRDKGCQDIYGVEINPAAITQVDGLLDKTWFMNSWAPSKKN